MNTPDGPILLFIGFLIAVLAWGARRARPSRPRALLALAAGAVAVVGGLALADRLPWGQVALLSDAADARVTLLTDAADAMHGACYLSFIEGELVADPAAGTAIVGRNGGSADERFPVMWPAGWTGRRTASSDVAVLSPGGEVVVRTGTRVHLAGGFYGRAGAWLACSDAHRVP